MVEEIALWLEKKNPALLFSLREVAPLPSLSCREKVSVPGETEVVIVEGVDRVIWKEFLQDGMKVLLVEEDLSKIQSLLMKEDFFPDENLYISTLSQEQLFPILKTFVFKKIHFEGELSLVSSYMGGMEMSFSEYRELGKDIIPNLLANMVHVSEYIDGRDLEGVLKNESALVCGSGISLDDVIKKLEGVKERPYIFAAGSALPLLLENGIVPDFFVCIDPSPKLEVFKALEKLAIPLFYQNRVSKELLHLHKGPKVYMGTGGAWQIEEAIMVESGRKTFPFEAGYNAGNFGAHIALSMGCAEVILAGMDGVAKEGEETSFNKEGMKSRGDLFYGMDFFRNLSKLYPKQKLLQYTKGFAFDRGGIIEELIIKGKTQDLMLPEQKRYSAKEMQRVIDRYFDHSMLELARDLFEKGGLGKEEQKLHASVVLAEFSTFPLYTHYLLPLWEIWKYLLPHSEEEIAQLTFFYSLLKELSLKCGFERGAFYLFGKKEGMSLRHDSNGTLREAKYFVEGREEGDVKLFDEGGRLLSLVEMKEGVRNGKFQVYAQGGLVREGQFIDGRPHGVHRCFHKELVVEEVCYEHGKKSGTHKTYTDEGKKLTMIVYKEGGFCDRFSYDDLGRTSYSAIWKDGIFTESFFEEGKNVSSREGKLLNGKVVFKGEI